jgi:hypothetical protein
LNEIRRGFRSNLLTIDQGLCATGDTVDPNRRRPITTAVQTKAWSGPRRPRRRRGRREDKFGLTFAFAAAAAVFALSAVAGTIARSRIEPSLSIDAQAAALRSGSILFVAPDGYPCRHKVIDNATWLIRDSGNVNCEAALSQITSQQRQKWSTDRVEAIRSGLTGR